MEYPVSRRVSSGVNRSWLLVVLLTALIASAYGFGVYLFAQLLPDMQRDLGFGYGFVGLTTAAGQLSFLGFSLLSPFAARWLGDTQVVLGSGAVCGGCLIGLGLVHDTLTVGVLLVILAGMSSSIWIPMIGIGARAVASEYRGTALGLISAGTSYGVFANSLLVPLLVPAGHWRMIWTLVGGATLILVLLAGASFLRLGLMRRPSDDSPRASLPKHSAKTWSIPLWVLLIWATMFLLGLSNSPFQNYLSAYLRNELHYDVVFAAQVWGVIGIVGMFAGLAMGWLSDKTSLRFTMLLIYLCILVAAVIFALGMSAFFLLCAGVLFALGFYPIFGLVPAYVSRLVVDENRAVMIFGVGNMCVGAGGMMGNYAGGLAAGLLGSFVWIYIGIAASALLLIVLLACLPRESMPLSS